MTVCRLCPRPVRRPKILCGQCYPTPADLSRVRTVPVRSRMIGGAGVLTAPYAEDREWLAEKYRTPGGNPHHPVRFADFLAPLLDAGYHL